MESQYNAQFGKRLTEKCLNTKIFGYSKYQATSIASSETHTRRQVTQQGCLPSFLGDGDKGIEIVYSEDPFHLYSLRPQSAGATPI